VNTLPAEDRQFHTADLPHGESVALDDSGWDVVKAGQKASKGAVWYRREIVVRNTVHGYDLTGSQIWFKFRVEHNGPMPEAIYLNGTRAALGDDLEPILLFRSAMPGDKVLVAVKVLHTVDEKSFRGAVLRIKPKPDVSGEGTSECR
jgi:alpha-mannosidase